MDNIAYRKALAQSLYEKPLSTASPWAAAMGAINRVGAGRQMDEIAGVEAGRADAKRQALSALLKARNQQEAMQILAQYPEMEAEMAPDLLRGQMQQWNKPAEKPVVRYLGDRGGSRAFGYTDEQGNEVITEFDDPPRAGGGGMSLDDRIKLEEAKARLRPKPAAGAAGGSAGAGSGMKPPPVGAIKGMNESREALRAFENSQGTISRLEALAQGGDDPNTPQIEAAPAMDVGPLSQGKAWVQNKLGNAGENTQKIMALKQEKEKLRGDYLLMSKGVQTEGDAKRAMDAMMPDTNDINVLKNQLSTVAQRMKEMAAIHDESLKSYEQYYGAPKPAGAAPAAPTQGGFKVIRRRPQ